MENTPRERDTPEEGGIEDMATRLAHLGILHWRVWSQLVYHADMDVEMSDGPPADLA
jgi:hypothetical protein